MMDGISMPRWTVAYLAAFATAALLSADRVICKEPASPPRTLAELGEQPAPGVEIPPALDTAAVQRAIAGGLPYESRGVWGMGPQVTPDQVRRASALADVPTIAGPVQESWQSIHDHYHPPAWLVDGKFGIFIHFGLYSIPGVNEWYQKYMYSNADIRRQHIERFGPLDQFGYKDFIPRFTLPNFQPNDWAELFAASGARWVMPTAEHHDGYSLWNSLVNRFNSARTGPRRDIVGELAAAVRQQGMKFGVTNHTIEHYNFIETANIPAEIKTDLYDPAYADFYWVDHSDERLVQHLANWVTRNVELIDGYEPDLIWFDNGLNHRAYDPLKIKVAAYYYNRAVGWNKEVTCTGKGTCFISGSIQDFEDFARVPRKATDFTWMVHDRLIDTWGYSENAGIRSADNIIRRLIEVVARNGVYALNVAPLGDGSIPEDQQRTLKEIGDWLQINGEAIYGTRPWKRASEGAALEDGNQTYSAGDIRFTSKGEYVYAIIMHWPAESTIVIKSLAQNQVIVTAVELLGHQGELHFTQSQSELTVSLPQALNFSIGILKMTARQQN
jgi:alpha-L-fucosidase